MTQTISHAYEQCLAKTQKSGSSFYYSFLLLDHAKKLAITSIYAFCREVDDIVDEYNEKSIAEQKLNFWANEIQLVFNDQPSHPIAIALQDTIQKFQLPQLWFEEILNGMFMDLKYQGYQTIQDLNVYCDCVASAVGRICATIFGYTHKETLTFASELGLALQYINIIRDIGADLRRNRVYIPEEFLANYKFTANDLLQQKIHDETQWIKMLTDFSQLAHNHYKTAIQNLHIDDRRNQLSGIIMAEIYFKLLNKITKKKFKVLTQKISITPINKVWTAYTTLRKEQKLLKHNT